MLRSILLTALFCLSGATSTQAQRINAEGSPAPDNSATAEFPQTANTAVITHRIIDAPNGTFGYEILSDGKLLVRQTNIPGRPGNTGCATKADAERLAALVAGKVKRGEMPPTVTKEELGGLQIIH